jgi:hypothetical protein
LGEAFADLDGRGLAGTVGSQQAKAFAGRDLEVEASYGDDVAKRLAESVDAEGEARGYERGACSHGGGR